MELSSLEKKSGKKVKTTCFSIVASGLILLGFGTYLYLSDKRVDKNPNLGTYENPEIAFKETQKALALLSYQLNIGMKSVSYVQEYNKAKAKIFIED